jgi:hypothetical protein
VIHAIRAVTAVIHVADARWLRGQNCTLSSLTDRKNCINSIHPSMIVEEIPLDRRLLQDAAWQEPGILRNWLRGSSLTSFADVC